MGCSGPNYSDWLEEFYFFDSSFIYSILCWIQLSCTSVKLHENVTELPLESDLPVKVMCDSLLSFYGLVFCWWVGSFPNSECFLSMRNLLFSKLCNNSMAMLPIFIEPLEEIVHSAYTFFLKILQLITDRFILCWLAESFRNKEIVLSIRNLLFSKL